jgi:hypothetical protein
MPPVLSNGSIGFEPDPGPPGSPAAMRIWVSALVGAIVGLLIGIVVDAAVWLFAFASALNGNAPITVPFIVSTSTSGADVIARSGLGVLVVPICAAVLGAGVGAVIARRSKAVAR